MQTKKNREKLLVLLGVVTAVVILLFYSIVVCAQEKPKVSAKAMGPLPTASVVPPPVPSIPSMESFQLTPSPAWLERYSDHPYKDVRLNFSLAVVAELAKLAQEQARQMVALTARVAALEKVVKGVEPNSPWGSIGSTPAAKQ